MKALALLVALGLLLALPVGQLAMADDDNPTLAILRFGRTLASSITEDIFLAGLYASGWLTEAELFTLQGGDELEGESLNVLWGDAQFDFTNISFIVDRALDQGADTLVTFSTPLTQFAVNATSDLTAPPAIFFSHVFNPFVAGIAAAPCVKPANVTGVELMTSYEDIVELLLLQDPDLESIGIIYSTTEDSGKHGLERLTEVAQAAGIEVSAAGVAAIADLQVAAAGLVEKGAQALVSPADLITSRGMPSLVNVASEHNIPLFHASFGAVNSGATFAAGATGYTKQGRILYTLVASQLAGELDISRVGIRMIDDFSLAYNAVMAARLGLEASAELLEQVDAIVAEGAAADAALFAFLLGFGTDFDPAAAAMFQSQFEMMEFTSEDAEYNAMFHTLVNLMLPQEGVLTENASWVSEMHCSDEMIAEQQAALDATDQ